MSASPESIVRRFEEEIVNGGRFELLGEVWAEDCEWHGGSLGDVYGLANLSAFMSANAGGAFSGMHLTIEETITTGEKVVMRFTNSGTQTGPFMGAEATGKRAEWLGIGIFTVRNERIVEAWFGEDILGMMLQLGVVDRG
jgi:predicted ester cyclase